MIEIMYNGSKWAGQEPDTIETLLEMLKTECLDPMFEDYGNFAKRFVPAHGWNDKNKQYKGCTSFHGNFLTVSHAFGILTDDPEIIDKLTSAIRANQQREDYKVARMEQITEKRLQAIARNKFERNELSLQQLYYWPTSEEGQKEKEKILSELTA